MHPLLSALASFTCALEYAVRRTRAQSQFIVEP